MGTGLPAETNEHDTEQEKEAENTERPSSAYVYFHFGCPAGYLDGIRVQGGGERNFMIPHFMKRLFDDVMTQGRRSGRGGFFLSMELQESMNGFLCT